MSILCRYFVLAYPTTCILFTAKHALNVPVNCSVVRMGLLYIYYLGSNDGNKPLLVKSPLSTHSKLVNFHHNHSKTKIFTIVHLSLWCSYFNHCSELLNWTLMNKALQVHKIYMLHLHTYTYTHECHVMVQNRSWLSVQAQWRCIGNSAIELPVHYLYMLLLCYSSKFSAKHRQIYR